MYRLVVRALVEYFAVAILGIKHDSVVHLHVDGIARYLVLDVECPPASPILVGLFVLQVDAIGHEPLCIARIAASDFLIGCCLGVFGGLAWFLVLFDF